MSCVMSTIVRPREWRSLNDREHLGARVAVEVAGGLVGQDQRRLGNQRAGDADSLLLAARELGRDVAQAIAQAQPLERRLGPVEALLAPARPGT